MSGNVAQNRAPGPSPSAHDRGHAALGLTILFIAQYVLFKSRVLGEVAPYYPAGYDQAAYLRDAYLLFESITAEGRTALLRALFSPDAAQGKLFTVQANAVFLVLGASRLAALLPNLLYFLALQASVFYLAKKAFGGHAVAFMAVGLLLMLAYPFYLGGRMFDFRMDFAAFSLYGIFVSAAVASRAFLSTGWSAVAALTGFLLVLLRHVALGYIGGVYVIMLVFFSAVYLASGRGEKRKETLKRIRNAILSGIAVFGAAFPFLWASRGAIYNYYIVGHFLGKEKDIRSPGWDLSMTASYYLRSIQEHLGSEAAFALKALAAAAIALSLFALLRKRSRAPRAEFISFENFVFLAIAAAMPLVMLMTDTNKNPFVAAVMITPALLFCTLAFARGTCLVSPGVATALTCAAAIVFMALGLKNQYFGYRAQISPEQRASLEDVTRMSLDVGDYCEANSIASPAISFDRIMDYMTDGSIMIVYYEQRQRLMRFKVQLADGIFDISGDKAVAKLKASDVVLFSPDPIGGNGYPFDKAMDAMRPALFSFVEKEFTRLKEYKLHNRTYYLFARPAGDVK